MNGSGFSTPTLATSITPNAAGGSTAIPDYGRDMWCLSDIDPGAVEVTGAQALAQACYRRLITTRGTLLGDPDYGYDLQGTLDDDLSTSDLARIASEIDSELVKDERVASSSTTVLFGGVSPNQTTQQTGAVVGPQTGVLNVYITITPAAGPTFSLTLAVSDLTTTLLSTSAT